MASDVYIGLAVTSHDVSQTCEAVFSNVTTTGNVSGQWVSQDIGIASNTAEPMYIGLTDSAGRAGIVEHEDPAATQIDTFTVWAVDLADFADQGVDIGAVTKMSLGVGDPINPVATSLLDQRSDQFARPRSQGRLERSNDPRCHVG